jgi:ribosomal silencing factor RsfS
MCSIIVKAIRPLLLSVVLLLLLLKWLLLLLLLLLFCSCCGTCSGRAGLQEQLIIATGLSQRHAHACAEAVAWQLKEAAKAYIVLQQQQQQQQEQQPAAGDIASQHISSSSRSSSNIFPAGPAGPVAAACSSGVGAAAAAAAAASGRQLTVDEQMPALTVLGDSGSDWAVVDAGRLVVHVLTGMLLTALQRHTAPHLPACRCSNLMPAVCSCLFG